MPTINDIIFLRGFAENPAVAVYNPANGAPFIVSCSHIGVGNLFTAKTQNGATVPVSPISVSYTTQAGTPATRLESEYPVMVPEFNQGVAEGQPTDVRFQCSLVPFYSSSIIHNLLPAGEMINCTLWCYFFQRTRWSPATFINTESTTFGAAFDEPVQGGDSSSPVFAVNNTTGAIWYVGPLTGLHPNGTSGLVKRVNFNNVPQPAMPSGYPASYPYPVPMPTSGVTPPGGQVVTGPVQPSAFNDPPRIWATMVGGGYQCRATIADRDGILPNARVNGMRVFVMENRVDYRLLADLTNWEVVAS